MYGIFKIARYKNNNKNKNWKKISKIQCIFKIYCFVNEIKKIYEKHILLCKHILSFSYRIEDSLDKNTLKNSTNVNIIARRMICAINIQRQTMKLIFL